VTSTIAPIELWHFRSFRAVVTSATPAELVWDWLAPSEEALIVDVSYSTPYDTPRHAICVDWYDPTAHASQPSRKVIAQTNDNAIFWNPVRWFIPRSPEGRNPWVLRAICAVPSGVIATLDVSVAIVRSSGGDPR
jgi:hypothetical protein